MRHDGSPWSVRFLRRSVHAFGAPPMRPLDLGSVRASVLRVPALVAALRASRRAVPATAVPELEAAAVAINRIN